MIAALVAGYLCGAFAAGMYVVDVCATPEVREGERMPGTLLAACMLTGLLWPGAVCIIAHRFLRACRGLPEVA
jgi:hypothetical protein